VRAGRNTLLASCGLRAAGGEFEITGNRSFSGNVFETPFGKFLKISKGRFEESFGLGCQMTARVKVELPYPAKELRERIFHQEKSGICFA
jgi:hypothetical protein